MIILIDNGHGKDTPGKRSPDSSLLEWKYTRDIARCICCHLKIYGYDCRLVTPEDNDIPVWERAKRVNKICDEVGIDNVILISIHLNAAGDGSKWLNGRGWECWTSIGNTRSDKLAEELYKAASYNIPGVKLRKDLNDGDSDKENNFTVIYKSKCPAVLTENLFMDNEDECKYLLSKEGKKAIIDLHVDGIISYISKKSI